MPEPNSLSENDVQEASITAVDEIAQWMYDEFQREGKIAQSTAVQRILEMSGEEHLYKNPNNNWAISKPILNKFKRLRGDEAVWASQLQLWRRRNPTDPPGSTTVRY